MLKVKVDLEQVKVKENLRQATVKVKEQNRSKTSLRFLIRTKKMLPAC
jgi:hypothetical protein